MKALLLALCLTVAIGMSSVSAVDIRGYIPESNKPVELHVVTRPQQAVNDAPVSMPVSMPATAKTVEVANIPESSKPIEWNFHTQPKQAVDSTPASVPLEWNLHTQPQQAVDTTPVSVPVTAEADEVADSSSSRTGDRPLPKADIRGYNPESSKPIEWNFHTQPQQAVDNVPVSVPATAEADEVPDSSSSQTGDRPLPKADIRGYVPESKPIEWNFHTQPQQAVDNTPVSMPATAEADEVADSSSSQKGDRQLPNADIRGYNPESSKLIEWNFVTQPQQAVNDTPVSMPVSMPTTIEEADEGASSSLGHRGPRLSRKAALTGLPAIPGTPTSRGSLLGGLPSGRYKRFGDTCAAWPAASQLQCILNWVISLITQGSQAIPGLNCAGTTPEQQILCIIDWVIMTELNVVGNITGNLNGTLGNITIPGIPGIPTIPGIPGLSGLPGLIQGCSATAPVSRLSCITSWVLAQQGNPGLVVGNTCAAFPPGVAQQTCINLWANFKKCGTSSLPGCSCLSLAPTDIQQCINDWVIQTQKALDPNAANSCFSVESGLQLACVNSWVLDQQAQNPYVPFPFPCSEFGSKALKKYCKNACIIGQQLKDTNGDPTNTCAAIDPSQPLEVASCVTAYLKTGIYNNCKS